MIIRLINKQGKDYVAFHEGFHLIFEPKYSLGIYAENPFRSKENLYFYAESDQGEFFGAVNFIFLKENTFAKLKSGNVEDDMFITQEDIESISDLSRGQAIYAYISSVFVLPQFRRNGYAIQLLNYGKRYIMDMNKEHNIEFLANCISYESIMLHKKFGMTELCKNQGGDTVMYMFADNNG